MSEQKYLAHIANDSRTQSVAEHSLATAKRCAGFAARFGAKQLGERIGLLHDIGKYSQEFQNRLRGGAKVDHSGAGAYECAIRGEKYGAFAIMGHHSGLPNLGSTTDGIEEPTFCGRFKRVQAGKIPNYAHWKSEIVTKDAPPHQLKIKDALGEYFFTRMLYSCLVDADYLDTEEFMDGVARAHEYDTISELSARLDEYTAKWYPPHSELNTVRCQILDRLKSCAEQTSTGLYTLTVPTGGGKTVSSLAFALRHAVKNDKARVIYVIPYTSIIEQTADVFRSILGENNVLEHHSNMLYDEANEATPHSVAMAKAAENWDMPVIVTTAVQFFESLYAARSSKSRKLHNIADSVIIFDEAQMLPTDCLRPCVAAIAMLVRDYGCSAVLMSATRPSLDALFSEFLPKTKLIELMPKEINEHRVFRRVNFVMEDKLTDEQLAARLNEQEQALVITNSRKAARKLYYLLSPDGAFHLSTMMYPNHRRETLKIIRQRLSRNERCRVVSTSLIEAGVDVDFPTVYREFAGLDSLLQSAGRCNREGKRNSAESIVHIYRSEHDAPKQFAMQIAACREAIRACPEISSQNAVDRYYRELFETKGKAALDYCGTLAQICDKTRQMQFRTVAENFRIINDLTKTIFIPIENGEALVKRFECGERTKALFRALNGYAVSVYKNDFIVLREAGDITLIDENTAILQNLALYSDSTGLSVSPEYGKAILL